MTAPGGVNPQAWERGRRDAAAVIAAAAVEVGAPDHILAVAPKGPWIAAPQVRWVRLHGGAYDDCRFELYHLGQHLTVGGEHGSARYEYKEHDHAGATYVAVGEATPWTAWSWTAADEARAAWNAEHPTTPASPGRASRRPRRR